MYLVISLLVVYLSCLVIKNIKVNRTRHNVFFCQYVCDDVNMNIIAKSKEESRIKEIGRLREEYLIWSNNCKQVFESNNKVSINEKVCRRTINGVA